MTFLRVDSSIRHQGSVSRELTDTVERAWLAENPGAEVVRRDLTAAATLHETWRQAASAVLAPEHLRTPAMRKAYSVAVALADEVLAAEFIAIGAPLYNFGIPAALKSWIDLLIIDPRFDSRSAGIGRSLAGVAVRLLIACGGAYGPETPRHGWDHSTPYLQRILGDLFGAEVTTIVAELTAADTDPTMAALRARSVRLSRTGSGSGCTPIRCRRAELDLT